MATRPVYLPCAEGAYLVKTQAVDFQWHAGMAISQKQKSIAALHLSACEQLSVPAVLEVSSKSTLALGVELSAFNLSFTTQRHARTMSVECAFQGSKVFAEGGPFADLYGLDSRQAKQDPRLQNSGRLVGFNFYGSRWELEPQTAFYDWLYLNALHKQPSFAEAVLAYRAFTDIEFNPERSINCQAYSVALYVALQQRGLLAEALQSRDAFLAILTAAPVSNAQEDTRVQPGLF